MSLGQAQHGSIISASGRKASFKRATGVFTNRRNQRLHTLNYVPLTSPPAARLFLHHGLAEHCGRYDPVCRRFAENGVAVHSFDAHGHGQSEPLKPEDRALVLSYPHLVDDFCDFIDHVLSQGDSSDGTGAGSVQSGAARGAAPPQFPLAPPSLDTSTATTAGPPGPSIPKGRPPRRPPVFLLGHSMGGLVAALACLRRQDRVAGLMLHSPALDVEWTPALRVNAFFGSVLSRLVPRARVVPAVRPEDLSQDPRVVAAYVADPLNTVGDVRARTAHELLTAFGEIRRRAPELRLPVYVCHGDHDATTSAGMSRRFVEGPGGVSSVSRVFRSVTGGYHELLHGPEWEECTAQMLRWMRGHGLAAVGVGGPAGGGQEQAPGSAQVAISKL